MSAPRSGTRSTRAGIFCAVSLFASLTLLRAGEISWLASYDQALQQAEATGKPLLVDFWADWCAPCSVMDAQLWSRADVNSLSQEFVFARIDVDEDRSLLLDYRVRIVPTMLITDSLGTEILRTEGYDTPDPYVEVIRIAHRAYPELAPWSARLKTEPKHSLALRELGRVLYEHGVYTISNDFYQRALKSPGTKEDKAIRAAVLTAIGWNELQLARLAASKEDALAAYGSAIRTFKKSLRPESDRRDVALFGLVVSHTRRGEIREAAEYLGELETEFPDSPATDQARAVLRRR